MSWKQRVSVVVLVLFTLVPVSGTLCATMCDFGADAPSTHHGSDENCEEATHSSTGAQIDDASDHDCSNHDAAGRQFASSVPERVGLKATAIVFVLSAGHAPFTALPPGAPALEGAGPPGTSPRTTTPLVLRV